MCDDGACAVTHHGSRITVWSSSLHIDNRIERLLYFRNDFPARTEGLMAATFPRPEQASPLPQSGRAGSGRSLDDEIQYVKGVGPAAAQILGKIRVHTAGDLLRHIPRRYEDRTRFRRIADLNHGEMATFRGKVIAADNLATNRKNF